MTRTCGDCQLCCRLLPVRELDKGANQRCKFQKFGKGCIAYGSSAQPACCKLWSCQWLSNPSTLDLRRPDRTGYVIDVVPDFVRMLNHDGSERNVEVIQIWCDPSRPTAYRDPALLAWLNEQGKPPRQKLGMVRFDASKAVVLWPPSITGRARFVEWDSDCSQMHPEAEHSMAEIRKALEAAYG